MLLLRVLLITCLLVLPVSGCRAKPLEDEECRVMREIGLSVEKVGVIRDWIASTLDDPSKLASGRRASGPLLGLNDDVGLDWAVLGIPKDRGLIELYGKGVDYRDLRRGSIEAVVVGYGNGYKIILKLQPNSDIDSELLEESKKPYGEIRMEVLSSDVLLVCQVNKFG